MRHTDAQRVIWRDKTTGEEARGSGAMAGWYASHPERYEQVLVPREVPAMKTPDKDPKYYLSKSEGRWRLIHGGVPICPDTDEEGARRAARFSGCDLSHGWIWDGDAGQWVAAHVYR